MKMRFPDAEILRAHKLHVEGMVLSDAARAIGWIEGTGKPATSNLRRRFLLLGLEVIKWPKKMPLRVSDEEVASIYARYLAGEPLDAIERSRGNVTGGNLLRLFDTRGLPRIKRPNAGQFVRDPEPTEAEITAAIESMPRRSGKGSRFGVPARLRQAWRRWDLAKRVAVCEQIKRHHGWRDLRPQGPYAPGFEPFVFGTPAAHALAERINAGLPSRMHQCQIRLASSGVIWEDRLWFWQPSDGYELGRFDDERGCRPTIHRTLWERHHGPLKSDEVVRFRDGNDNNLVIENLYLASKNEVCRENQAAALARKAREVTDALLKRQTLQDNHGLLGTLR